MQKNAVVLAILLCCCTSATAAPVGFTTMHLDADQAYIPWGLPLEGGPIRTLLVAPRNTARDGVALAQRMELELTFVPLQTRDSLGDDENRETTLEDLRRAISGRIDLIILANIDAAAVPEEIWTAVAERVRDGSGLVLANHDLHEAPALQELLAQGTPLEDLRPITAGISEGITPEWTSGLHFVQALTAGEGRVVALDYGPDRPATQSLLPPLVDPLLAFPEFLDTYYSLIAKAARWAARREPHIFIDALLPAGPAGPREEEIPPQLPPEFLQRMRDAAMPGLLHPYALRFSEPADRDYDVIVQTRRLGRSHEEVFSQELALAKGTGEVHFDLYGGAGQYLVDIWLATRKGVVEWHTATVQLPGWPEFKNLRFSKDFILPNDAIDISVDVRPHFAQPRPCCLYARALDRDGRLVSEVTVEVPEDGGLAMATLSFADILTPMLKVEAYLVDSPARPFAQWELNAAAFEYLYVAVQQPQALAQPELAVLAPAAFEYGAQYYLHRLVESGATAAYIPFEDGLSWPAAAAGLAPITEVAEYAPAWQDGQRLPCLSDPRFRDAEAARLQQVARITGSGGSPRFSLGLANGLPGDNVAPCRSSACTDRMRTWLQAHYESLDTLNQAWGTNFADWDSVEPLDRDDALGRGRLAAAMDDLRFEEEVVEEFHSLAQDTIVAITPQARVGYQPLDPANTDWRRLVMKHGILLTPPDPVAELAARSWRQRGAWLGITWQAPGVFDTPERLAWTVWHGLMRQAAGTVYLNAYGTAAAAGEDYLLTREGEPSTQYQPLFDAVRRVREDVGPLLLAATPRPARVAILDDTLSRLYSTLDSSMSVGYREGQRAWIAIFAALGYTTDLVAPADIAAGGLSRYEVLILSEARALEDATVSGIEAWLSQGKCLIADIAPRLYTPLGLRPCPLFPVEYTGPGQSLAVAGAKLNLPLAEGHTSGALPAVLSDAHVSAGSMTEAGDSDGRPLWLQDASGTRLLLNHGMTADTQLRDASLPLIDAWIRARGIKPDVPLFNSARKRFHGDFTRYTYGAAEIYAFLRDCDSGGGDKLEVPLVKGGTLHELVTLTTPPRAKKIASKLGAGEAAIFVALPYRVMGLSVTAPELVRQGQRLEFNIHLDTDTQSPGRHLVQVSLVPSLRPPLAYYRQFVVCEKGHGHGYIPLALNELPGRYTLRLLDILSGQTAEVVVDIELRQPAVQIQ